MIPVFSLYNIIFNQEMKKKSREKSRKKRGKRTVAGTLRDMRPSIRQLSQRGLPRDMTDKIIRELAATTIQDQFNEKYIGNIRELLDEITLRQLDAYKPAFEHFLKSVNATYEYSDRQTPRYLLDIRPMVESALRQTKMLIGLKRNPDALRQMFKRAGYRRLGITVATSINNIQNAITAIQGYRQIAVDDYRGAELGIESHPRLTSTATRKVDAISRPPRTVRQQAMTSRRARSR